MCTDDSTAALMSRKNLSAGILRMQPHRVGSNSRLRRNTATDTHARWWDYEGSLLAGAEIRMERVYVLCVKSEGSITCARMHQYVKRLLLMFLLLLLSSLLSKLRALPHYLRDFFLPSIRQLFAFGSERNRHAAVAHINGAQCKRFKRDCVK